VKYLFLNFDITWNGIIQRKLVLKAETDVVIKLCDSSLFVTFLVLFYNLHLLVVQKHRKSLWRHYFIF